MSSAQITIRINRLIKQLEHAQQTATVLARNHPDSDANTYFLATAGKLAALTYTARHHYPSTIIV